MLCNGNFNITDTCHDCNMEARKWKCQYDNWILSTCYLHFVKKKEMTFQVQTSANQGNSVRLKTDNGRGKKNYYEHWKNSNTVFPLLEAALE